MGMKVFMTLVIALVAIPFACGLAPALGMTEARLDVHVALAVFLGVACPGVRGILGAFAVGWLADLMTGHPTGLVMCATLYAYVFSRIRGAFDDIVSPVEFAFLCAVIEVVYGFSCRVMAMLGGLPVAPSMTGLFLSALALAPVAALLFVPLSFLERRYRKNPRSGYELE